jgi:hypothetical protein
VGPGKARCSGNQQKQALQSAADDNETVSGPTSRQHLEVIEWTARTYTHYNTKIKLSYFKHVGFAYKWSWDRILLESEIFKLHTIANMLRAPSSSILLL